MLKWLFGIFKKEKPLVSRIDLVLPTTIRLIQIAIKKKYGFKSSRSQCFSWAAESLARHILTQLKAEGKLNDWYDNNQYNKLTEKVLLDATRFFKEVIGRK